MKKLIILTMVLLTLFLISGCSPTGNNEFMACMEYCVEQVDGRCMFHTIKNNIHDCQGMSEIEIQILSEKCYNECRSPNFSDETHQN